MKTVIFLTMAEVRILAERYPNFGVLAAAQAYALELAERKS